MKKFVAGSLFLVLGFLFLAVKANAGESNCQIVYGGGEVCTPKQVKFTINKLVQKPGKGGGEFVENLTIADPRFSPNSNVNFKIVIENTGDSDITNLNVADNFGEFLSFVAGVGNASVGAKQINFIIGTLNKGQKVEFVITAKTAEEGKFPSSQAVTCTVNNVKATSPDGATAEDNSQICVEKNVLGAVPTPQIFEKPTVKEIPATGPELLGLAALIPFGAAGIYLRKKASAKGGSASGGK